jgi:hypothetical protein
MMMLYVRMRDKFMSGWGGARGKKSIYVVECETDEQATAILHAAEDRSEMVNISILSEKPVARANQVMTVRSFKVAREKLRAEKAAEREAARAAKAEARDAAKAEKARLKAEKVAADAAAAEAAKAAATVVAEVTEG